MSKSLDFCIITASDPEKSQYSHRDWSQSVELDSEEIFDEFIQREFGGETEIMVSGSDDNGEKVMYGVRVTVDPEADFSYFTSASTVIFGEELSGDECGYALVQNIDACVNKVFSASTYDIKVGRPEYGNIIHYTVGNFVVLAERNYDSQKTEVTVLLPIRMKILREGMV